MLLGCFVGLPAIFLGIDVGYGDGNAVDLEKYELAEKKRELLAKKTKSQ